MCFEDDILDLIADSLLWIAFPSSIKGIHPETQETICSIPECISSVIKFAASKELWCCNLNESCITIISLETNQIIKKLYQRQPISVIACFGNQIWGATSQRGFGGNIVVWKDAVREFPIFGFFFFLTRFLNSEIKRV